MQTKTYFVAKYKVEGVEDYATLKDCYNFLTGKRLLGLDIETTRKFPNRKEAKKGEVYRGGLDPYLTNVVMIQIGNLDSIYVIDVRDFTQTELKPLIRFISWNPECTFVGVNLKFEGKHLRHNYNIRLQKVWDCMIVEMCLYSGLQRKFSLAGMSYEYLNIKQVEDVNLFELEKTATLNDDFIAQNEYLLTPFEVANTEQIDKSTRMEFVTIGKKPFTAKQILYGSDDIIYPLLIMERQLLGRKLSNGEVYLPMKLFRLENSFTQVIADMELNGLPFDKEKWLEIANKQQVLFDERLDILNKYVMQFYPKFVEPPNLFDFEQRCNIEWTSSNQVIKLFRYLDICPQEFSKSTKKMDWTVGATALVKMLTNELKASYAEQSWLGFEMNEDRTFVEDNHRFILAYLLFKRTEQATTTFGKEWLKYIHPITNRVHSNFRQILNSGRMASSSPNCQNIPSGEYRDAFRVDDEELKNLIFADFANQEVRTVACLAEEDSMLDFFINGHPEYGDDMHMYTANEMSKAHDPNAAAYPAKGQEGFTKVHKKKRDEAKIISFGILYGKEAKGFGEDFGLPAEEAQGFIDNYFGAYPKLKIFMDAGIVHTMRNQYIKIDNVVDRRWFSPDFDEMEDANEEVRSYYPEDYFKRGGMTKEAKEIFKEELYMEFPHVKELWRKFFGIKGSLSRKSTNYRIQGCSASETKTALVMMRRELIEKGIEDILIITSVHDEIGIEVLSPERVEYAKEFIERNMMDGANIFLNPPIMKATAEVGKTWIH